MRAPATHNSARVDSSFRSISELIKLCSSPPSGILDFSSPLLMFPR